MNKINLLEEVIDETLPTLTTSIKAMYQHVRGKMVSGVFPVVWYSE
jgi:hypothetical protein